MTDSTKDSGSCDRLKKDFFECSCEQLARKLLGQRLVRILADGRRLSGRIVETEAYVGAEDKAAHSYKGKRTARNEAMFMQPGTAYVYHIYGTLTCVNVSSQGEGHAVLIRALEPEEGLPQMKKHRGVKRADGGEGLKLTDLASGPSKLTQALSINRAEFDKEDLVSCKRLWLEEGSLGADEQVVSTARVGIEKAEEWASKPLRFYLKGCNSVSVIDKKAEAELQYEDAEPKKAKKRSHFDEEEAEVGSSSESDDECAPTEAKQPAISTDTGLGSAADRLKRDFFECSCEQLARKLLGQRLVRILADGRRLSGRIVETEAYVGAEDKAAHSYKGMRTARNEAMFMQPGTAYVYHIYGTLTCVNVSSQGEGHAVLIRALEPEEGLPQMKKHRGVKRADGGEGLKLTDLASGPSKLTQALSINRAEFDKEDLVSCKRLWLEKGSLGADEQVVSTARVGIEKAEEWASKPLRFYLKGYNSVSVIDKKAEAELQYEDAEPKIAKKRSHCDEEEAEVGSSSESDDECAATEAKQPAISTDTGLGSAADRLKRDFFECSCEQLARKLLGQRLVRILADGRRLSGRIVETEAYVGAEDKAAHSYKGKRTARNEAMFMQPGTAYVYHIYGTLTCVNVSSQGEGHAVLIRAIEPEEGLFNMKQHRGAKREDGGKGLKLTDLGSGPSKLTQALSINRAEFDKEDLVSCKRLWLEEGSLGADEQVVSTARVGIEKAEDWASKPLRFYLRHSNSVSVIDKKAEAALD